MSGKYAGRGLLAVNGLPIIHCASIDYDTNTNRELAVGTSPTGEAIGFVDGVKEYSLNIEVYIPKTGDVDWQGITNGVVTVVAAEGDGLPAKTFTGFFVQTVGNRFSEKGAAKRRITGKALSSLGSD